MFADWLSISAVTLATVIALYLTCRRFGHRNFPPGPPAFPFIGNILSFGRRPHVAMLNWKAKYGDVYRVYAGRKPMVILSHFETIRKVFANDMVTGRDCQSAIRIDETTQLDTGLIFSQGDLWKTHRRFALQTLRDLGMGKNWLEDTIIVEVEGLCQTLRETNGKPFNPKLILNNSVSNVICALIFGQRFDLADPNFSRLTNLVTENVESIALDSVAQTFPFLMWFPNYVSNRILRARSNTREMMAFLRKRILERYSATDGKASVHDYVYVFQTEAERVTADGAMRGTFDEQQLLSSLVDLFIAGTETTSTTALWAFVFMIENPDVMRTVQDEIDCKIGRHRILTNSDRGLLPYTEAVILEVQRVASLAPLGLPHTNLEEIIIDGYTVPKGTLIAANLYSIHRDPRWWERPLEFDPHRFLDVNMKLVRPDGFAPFSVGKRACLGEALAKMELFLFIANLLRCFTLELPSGREISRDDYTSSVVNSPLPFELLFVPRS